MHTEQTEFVKKALASLEIPKPGMSVLDVGSLDINGSNKGFFTDCKYTGIDIGPGNNVDIISRAHEYTTDEKFDIVISTECFEHDEFWQLSIQNIVNNLLKDGGFFIFTCATHGRAEHGTTRSLPGCAPYIQEYYKNLDEIDFKTLKINDVYFTEYFKTYHFQVNQNAADIYFFGIKK
jgi:cyclopropane fatty-acyl-phospholipid synthase-like methyltransferase